MNNTGLTRLGDLLVSRWFLAFGWRIWFEWCPDRLDLPMEYLQLQNWLSVKNYGFFMRFVSNGPMSDQYFTLGGDDGCLLRNDSRRRALIRWIDGLFSCIGRVCLNLGRQMGWRGWCCFLPFRLSLGACRSLSLRRSLTGCWLVASTLNDWTLWTFANALVCCYKT